MHILSSIKAGNDLASKKQLQGDVANRSRALDLPATGNGLEPCIVVPGWARFRLNVVPGIRDNLVESFHLGPVPLKVETWPPVGTRRTIDHEGVVIQGNQSQTPKDVVRTIPECIARDYCVPASNAPAHWTMCVSDHGGRYRAVQHLR